MGVVLYAIAAAASEAEMAELMIGTQCEQALVMNTPLGMQTYSK